MPHGSQQRCHLWANTQLTLAVQADTVVILFIEPTADRSQGLANGLQFSANATFRPPLPIRRPADLSEFEASLD